MRDMIYRGSMNICYIFRTHDPDDLGVAGWLGLSLLSCIPPINGSWKALILGINLRVGITRC